MNIFQKITNVLSHNLGYTVVLVVAIVLFAVFSNGLLSGIITALSALVSYACVMSLYGEYKKSTPATAPKKTRKTTKKK